MKTIQSSKAPTWVERLRGWTDVGLSGASEAFVSHPVICCLPHWPSQHALLLPPFPSRLFSPISFSVKRNCDWCRRFGAKARKGQQHFTDAASSCSVSNCSSEIHSRPTTERPSPKSRVTDFTVLFTENRRTERKALNPRPNHLLYFENTANYFRCF